MSDNKIQEWVELALKDEDIFNYTISTNGTTEKDEGYIGDIFFITVTGKTKANETKTLNLVIKASKVSEVLRQQTPVKDAFKKEIFIYSKVCPSFDRFQKEIGADNLLDFLPHFYASRVCDEGEVLVFEDLRTMGYTSINRRIFMPFAHLKLVLQAYGKWHAFSFALREKRKDIFEDLCKDNINMYSHFILKVELKKIILDAYNKAKDASILPHEKGILQQLTFSEDDVNYIFTGLYSEEAKHHVISHGDCWNGNYLFKYDGNSAKPISVCVLDWQCSGFSSPVMDLSHFIYGSCDTGKYQNVSEFLKIYYQSFSDCLEKLGCNAEDLFPYHKLVEHWRRFSRFGILIQAFNVKFSMCDAESVPDFAEAAEQGKDFQDNFELRVSDPTAYNERTRNNFLHYVKNLSLCVE